MAWFLFIDESGHDRKASPYEVLAGVAINDRVVSDVVRQLQEAEVRCPSANRADEEKKAMKRRSAPKPPLRIVVTPPNFVKRNFAAATWANEAIDG